MFGFRRPDGDHGRVAVLGLGRFGSSLAENLTESGVEVLAVDSSHKLVGTLGETITHAVVADTTDLEALKQIGLPDFTHAVVAIGSDIEASILTTTLLSEMGIPDIWAKAVTATHGRILSRVGAHHVVFPESETGRRVAKMVTGSLLDYFQLDDDMAFVKCHPPAGMVDRVVDVRALADRAGVRVVAVARGQRGYREPEAVAELRADDVLVLCGPPERVREFTTHG